MEFNAYAGNDWNLSLFTRGLPIKAIVFHHYFFASSMMFEIFHHVNYYVLLQSWFWTFGTHPFPSAVNIACSIVFLHNNNRNLRS